MGKTTEWRVKTQQNLCEEVMTEMQNRQLKKLSII